MELILLILTDSFKWGRLVLPFILLMWHNTLMGQSANIDKSHFVKMQDPLNVLLESWYLVEIFCSNSHQKSKVIISVAVGISFSGFSVSVTPALENEFGNAPSSSRFGRVWEEFGINSLHVCGIQQRNHLVLGFLCWDGFNYWLNFHVSYRPDFLFLHDLVLACWMLLGILSISSKSSSWFIHSSI